MTTIVRIPFDRNVGLELRIAHPQPTSGTQAEFFPNQQKVPAYVEPTAYIRGNQFVSASLAGPDVDGYYAVHLELTESAAKKIDELSRQSNFVGLGVFNRGTPIQLIQVIHGISGNQLSWHGFETEADARETLALFD